MKHKHVRDSTPEEAAQTLAELKRPKPEPVDLETAPSAREMTEAERKEWLREHKRRFG
jgi:hypothetical protein